MIELAIFLGVVAVAGIVWGGVENMMHTRITRPDPKHPAPPVKPDDDVRWVPVPHRSTDDDHWESYSHR